MLRSWPAAALAGANAPDRELSVLRSLFMKKKMILASALLALVFVPQAFSRAIPFAKLTLGGAFFMSSAEVVVPVNYYGIPWEETYDTPIGLLFAIRPAGGVEWRSERADGRLGITSFALEASLGLGFGGSEPSIKVVNPGVMGILSFHLWKIVPYVGLGLSVPMFFSDSGAEFYSLDYKFGDEPDSFAYSLLTGNFLLGLGFKATENIMPTLEISAAVGALSSITIDIEARLGCMVRFGRF